ncbi:MAG: hypothetical protein GX032_00280 [Tenericutes bacterium]|nr:hypothetical protein [Mycoplasmatota bacterium]
MNKNKKIASMLALITLMNMGASNLVTASASERPLNQEKTVTYPNRTYSRDVVAFLNAYKEGAALEGIENIGLETDVMANLDTAYNALMLVNGRYPFDDLDWQDINKEAQKASIFVERVAYYFGKYNKENFRISNYVVDKAEKELFRREEDRYQYVHLIGNKDSYDQIFRSFRGLDRYPYSTMIEIVSVCILAGAAASIPANYIYEEKENGTVNPRDGRSIMYLDENNDERKIVFFANNESGTIFTEFSTHMFQRKDYTEEELNELVNRVNAIKHEDNDEYLSLYGLIRDINDVENKAIQAMNGIIANNISEKQRNDMLNPAGLVENELQGKATQILANVLVNMNNENILINMPGNFIVDLDDNAIYPIVEEARAKTIKKKA